MAKPKRQASERVSVVLASGVKVSGPHAAVARLVARHGEQKPAPRKESAKSDDKK